jgi:hypothetical protein
MAWLEEEECSLQDSFSQAYGVFEAHLVVGR